MLYDKEVKWRKDASENLMPELEKYNLVIKHNIGLRLQSRLTKDQAKFVAKCNSIPVSYTHLTLPTKRIV